MTSPKKLPLQTQAEASKALRVASDPSTLPATLSSLYHQAAYWAGAEADYRTGGPNSDSNPSFPSRNNDWARWLETIEDTIEAIGENPNTPPDVILRIADWNSAAVGRNPALQLLSLEDPSFWEQLLSCVDPSSAAPFFTGEGTRAILGEKKAEYLYREHTKFYAIPDHIVEYDLGLVLFDEETNRGYAIFLENWKQVADYANTSLEWLKTHGKKTSPVGARPKTKKTRVGARAGKDSPVLHTAQDPATPTATLQKMMKAELKADDPQWNVINEIAKNPNYPLSDLLWNVKRDEVDAHVAAQNPAWYLLPLEHPNFYEDLTKAHQKIFRQIICSTKETRDFFFGPLLYHLKAEDYPETWGGGMDIAPGEIPWDTQYYGTDEVKIYENGWVEALWPEYREDPEEPLHKRSKYFPDWQSFRDVYIISGFGIETLQDFLEQLGWKPPKGKVGQATYRKAKSPARIGAMSSTTAALIRKWKAGDKWDWHTPDVHVREAAADPSVPSEFLVWLMKKAGSSSIRDRVLSNPNLSLSDLWTLLHIGHLQDVQGRWTTIHPALAILQNPSLEMYLLEDPGFMERLFTATKPIASSTNLAVYEDKVREFLAHPVVAQWLGAPSRYTFKKTKRDSTNLQKWKLPLEMTVYANGVVHAVHPKRLENHYPLYRTFDDYLNDVDYRGNTPNMGLSEFGLLSWSDQMQPKHSAKTKK